MSTPTEVFEEALNDEERLFPILEFPELVEIFEYKNERAARRALRMGTFPVPTFEFAGRTVAHVDVIGVYFTKKRAESMAEIGEMYDIDTSDVPETKMRDLSDSGVLE